MSFGSFSAQGRIISSLLLLTYFSCHLSTVKYVINFAPAISCVDTFYLANLGALINSIRSQPREFCSRPCSPRNTILDIPLFVDCIILDPRKYILKSRSWHNHHSCIGFPSSGKTRGTCLAISPLVTYAAEPIRRLEDIKTVQRLPTDILIEVDYSNLPTFQEEHRSILACVASL